MSEQIIISAEERAQFEEFKREQEKKKAAELKKQQLEDYRALVDNEIAGALEELEYLSSRMSTVKKMIFENFLSVIAMKRDLLNLSQNEGQFTHTFTSSDSQSRITIGNRTIDRWDDTVEDGIEMVREFIQSLSTTEESALLVKTVMQLLSRDKKGNVQASRVIQLLQIAQESKNDRFIEGVELIWRSYRPEPSKTFIKAEKKQEDGSWKVVPLSMTEVE